MDWVKFFYKCMDCIQKSYSANQFYCERDLVWTVQKMIAKKINDDKLPYKVFNDYPIEKGVHRSKSVDLSIVNIRCEDRAVAEGIDKAELVIEFKYEPSIMRKKEICIHKLPVVMWSDVKKDIKRVKSFVENGRSKAAISVFIDEYSRNNKPQKQLLGSEWIKWESCNSEMLNISVLYTEVIC